MSILTFWLWTTRQSIYIVGNQQLLLIMLTHANWVSCHCLLLIQYTYLAGERDCAISPAWRWQMDGGGRGECWLSSSVYSSSDGGTILQTQLPQHWNKACLYYQSLHCTMTIPHLRCFASSSGKNTNKMAQVSLSNSPAMQVKDVPFKVIQGHLSRSKSKARTWLPIRCQ